MRRLLALLILGGALVGWAGPAHACSCAVLEPKQILEFAPVAFVGTLVGREPIGQGEFGGQDLFTFEVERVLAGEVAQQVGVVSPNNGAACGIEAAVGSRLAVFASLEGGRLHSGLCSVTDPGTALEALGPGTAPVEGAGTDDPPPGRYFDWGALGLAAAALALVGVVWAISRR